MLEPIIRFVAVTVVVLLMAGAFGVVGRLLSPNGEGDIEEARMRQDARRALTKDKTNAG